MLHGGKEGKGRVSGVSPAQSRGRWREMRGPILAQSREIEGERVRERKMEEKREREKERKGKDPRESQRIRYTLATYVKE